MKQGMGAIQQRKTPNGAKPFPPTSMGTAGGFDTTDSTRGGLRFTTFFNPHACWNWRREFHIKKVSQPRSRHGYCAPADLV